MKTSSHDVARAVFRVFVVWSCLSWFCFAALYSSFAAFTPLRRLAVGGCKNEDHRSRFTRQRPLTLAQDKVR